MWKLRLKDRRGLAQGVPSTHGRGSHGDQSSSSQPSAPPGTSSHLTSAELAREASLVAQLVKNPPAMQETPVRFLGWEEETPVRFLGWEDPLEKG